MAGTITSPHQAWNWATIPKHQLSEGIVRQMIHGERLMICRLTIAPGTMTTAHDHAHEQMTIVEKGRVRFIVGTEEKIFGPGDVLLLPGGFWHGATMLDEEVVLLDIFSPIREEFLEPAAART
ncbi:MAG TPA: cupin domain-containing protein [Vicinamibacterales bacterium]|nr:cupin domain-containing protein [Vicinamibacterales bacterium]